MEILWYQKSNYKNITELVNQIVWSGNENEVSRKLELEILFNPNDVYIQKLNFNIGDFIIFNSSATKELFQGFILEIEKNSQNSNLSLVCVDALYYLLKSEGIYNFTNKTAEFITKTICNEAKIEIGNLVQTNIIQNLPANDNLFNIIKDAYEYSGTVNGKYYIISMKNGKLYVNEKGTKTKVIYLAGDTNITGSTYSESAEDMINIVKIYDESGKQIGEVKNGDNIIKYGVFQAKYEIEENKDYNIVANNMLKGLSKSLNLEALGNIECITGNVINIKDNILGINNDYIIISDTHTFSDGIHTMSLEIREGY